MRFDGSEPKNPPLSSTLSRLAGSAPFIVIDPKSCAVSLRGLSQCAGVILLQPGPINGLADKSVSACMMPVIHRYENYCFFENVSPTAARTSPSLVGEFSSIWLTQVRKEKWCLMSKYLMELDRGEHSSTVHVGTCSSAGSPPNIPSAPVSNTCPLWATSPSSTWSGNIRYH